MAQENPKRHKLDDTDLLILQLLYNQDHDDSRKGKARYSLQELNQAVPNLRSVSTIYDRVIWLEDLGLVHHPGGRAARSRTITDEGIRTLRHGLGLPTT
jgi:Fe2+ or Zn2+ uptake regulation protein